MYDICGPNSFLLREKLGAVSFPPTVGCHALMAEAQDEIVPQPLLPTSVGAFPHLPRVRESLSWIFLEGVAAYVAVDSVCSREEVRPGALRVTVLNWNSQSREF